MNIRHIAVVMGVGLLVVACGDDDDTSSKPAAQTATVNQDAAKANAQNTISAIAATTGSGETGSSVGALSGAAQGSGSLLSTQPGATGTRSVAQGLNIEGGVHQLDIGDPGCQCDASAHSCTFTNCSFGANGTTGTGSSYTFSIDGSYSWGGGHVLCNNLKYTFKGDNLGAGTGASSGTTAGISTDTVVTLNCDITITDSSINGFVQSAGTSSTSLGQTAYSSTWDIKSTYNAVTFDTTSKRATGGSLHVEGTASVAAGGQAYNYAGKGDVTFP